MFLTIAPVVTQEGYYDGSNYSEPIVDTRVFFSPEKKALFKMLREVGFTPWDISQLQVISLPEKGGPSAGVLYSSGYRQRTDQRRRSSAYGGYL